MYLLLVVATILGVLCGALHGDDPSNNDVMIFLLLFNALFGTLAATSTIASLGGDGVALCRHEAASGVAQTAEVAARLLVDLLGPLWCLPIVFALPVKGLCNLPLPFGEMMSIYCLVAYALSPLGYVFTLVAPGNAVVLTSSAALVTCAFGTGFFGLKLRDLPESMRNLLPWLSPGCPALSLISVGSTLHRPLSTPRATVLTHLLNAGLLTQPDAMTPLEDVHLGTSGKWWQRDSVVQLLAYGSALRLLAMVLFVWRNNSTWRRWFNAVRVACFHRGVLSRSSIRPPPTMHLVSDSAEALAVYSDSYASSGNPNAKHSRAATDRSFKLAHLRPSSAAARKAQVCEGSPSLKMKRSMARCSSPNPNRYDSHATAGIVVTEMSVQ